MEFQPQIQTHIMYKANLNSKQVLEYLSLLTTKGYVTFEPGDQGNEKGKYTITALGHKYLATFAEIRRLVN